MPFYSIIIMAQDDYKNDIKPEPSSPPFSQAISHIAWAPTIPNIFAVTTWSGELRVYEVGTTAYGPALSQRGEYKFQQPAMRCTWNSDSRVIYIGLMDGTIKAMDMGSGQVADLGKHTANASINSLHFFSGLNVIGSTAYEKVVHFWQPNQPNPILSIPTDDKIFSCDMQFPTIIAGCSNEKFMMADITNPQSKTIIDSTDLGKFSQIQTIAINPKGTIYGAGTIDGRANLSTLSRTTTSGYTMKSVITFKSNKQEQGGITVMYPINATSFHPLNQRWFMTAGSDGGMHFWDFQAKSKIKSLHFGGIPITCAKVSPKGDMIAYGLGNDWHIGEEGSAWKTQIGVHLITENETRCIK